MLIDDIVDSAGTLCNAAAALMDQGAANVMAYCSHGVLSGAAAPTDAETRDLCAVSAKRAGLTLDLLKLVERHGGADVGLAGLQPRGSPAGTS